jgi:hypothetical protein
MVEAETVHTGVLFDANATVSPESEDAFSANATAPNVWLPIAANVIVCAGSAVTVNACATGVAAA